jgi:adenine deaminase
MFTTSAGVFLPKWTPAFGVAAYLRFGRSRSFRRLSERSVKNACKAVMQMHEAGIPIVVGTDSGNWPMVPSCFHGPSMIREIELLGEVGMAPMDVLQSATRIPAEMMGIDHLVGTVEVGRRADLIVVGEDPLSDLSALHRSLRYTIRDGDARTPEEWLQAAHRPPTEIRRKATATGEGTWQTTDTQAQAYSSPTPAS